jgi:hypothetical protein
MSSGALLFGRYAFPPNRLGYCGPREHEALFAYVAEQRAEEGLLDLERRFEGAYPYLRLIAGANDIADPLDLAVVEAYWVGNACLDNVDGANFYTLLSERAQLQLGGRAQSWLANDQLSQARPHHVFTVFDLYMRMGMLRDSRAKVILRSMDSCRISWGQVLSVEDGELIVKRAKLELWDGLIGLSAPETLRVQRRLDGRGFTEDALPGGYVSIHWNWACDVLTAPARERLSALTERFIALVNTALGGAT